MGGKAAKCEQLGMNISTAQHRLRTDILFDFVTHYVKCCYRCGGELKRDDFSIEHIEPWLHSEDPVGIFFDLDNITFSHLSCNYSNARQPNKKTPEQRRKTRRDWYINQTVEKRQNKRRSQYLKTGN